MSRKQTDLIQALRLRSEFGEEANASELQEGEGILHFRDLAGRLLVRWHWIALGLILGLGVGFYQVWRAVPQYQSRATVLVRDYNVSVMGQLDPAEFDLRNMQAIETVRAGLRTYELCESVASDPTVREMKGLVPPQPKNIPFLSSDSGEKTNEATPPAPQLAYLIQSWLSVSIQPDTRLIDIHVAHPKPLVAQTVANRVVEHYMKRRTSSRFDDQESTLRYLIAESQRMKGDLQDARNVLASYSAPLEAEKELAAAETLVDTLALRYRHKHPTMISAQARRSQAQSRLRDFLLRAIRNPFDESYWQEHRDRVGKLETSQAIDQIRDLLISRHAVLESEIESQNSLYRSLLHQIEIGEVNTKQSDAEVTPQEAAQLSGSPVSPRKARILLQASALGLFAGLGLAFLFQALDNKFHTVADVESHQYMTVSKFSLFR